MLRPIPGLTVVCAVVFSMMFLSAAYLSADVKPHSLIADHMVLQRKMRAPIWGTAEPGERVTVSIAGQTARTTADKTGSWMVRLKPMKAGGPHEMTITGKNTIKLENVMVGEVWVGSGQSNMNFELRAAMNAEEEVDAANYPNIRLFRAYDKSLPEPVKNIRGRWRVCTPKYARGFSAVGYFFGRYLHRELNIPIGVIVSSHGASPAEAWTEADALKKCIPDAVERWGKVRNDHIVAKHKRDLAKWEKEGGKTSGKRKPNKPRLPRNGSWVYLPSGFWNGGIAPLVPYGIRGVIWYQGESNTPRPGEYHKLLSAMIRSWRKEWGQGDFPFLIAEVAPYMAIRKTPTDSNYAALREAQRITAKSVTNSGLASTTDIGAARDPHPKNKQDVGKRLALVALAKTYGMKKLVYSGPVYKSMKVKGNRVQLKFEHVHGGLVVKGDGPLKGFAVAGKNRKFVWAQAKIVGKTIVVWSDEVANPVAVRYAWANNPVCNLFNADELPAPPFRTDDWQQRK